MSLFDQPPVFIVGAQRSGTTWLQRMLAELPEVISGQESHLFSGYLAPAWERWQIERAQRDNGNRTVGLACYLTEEELVEELRGFAQRTFERLIPSKPTATRFVEKTPDHALHLPLIHRLFPDATVIHVLRDGRDVVASLMDAAKQEWGSEWAPPTIHDACDRWQKSVTSIQEHLPLFSHSMRVRYEDLIFEGPAKLKEVIHFLNLTCTEEQIEDIHQRWTFNDNLEQQQESLIIRGECNSGREPQGF